ncbi:hypothetical protein [Mariniflexile sp.]|uniref:hypothetical protein n=1 Tax=Mariniflexile sp. TaxID=1979402 RepID=UPI00356AD628
MYIKITRLICLFSLLAFANSVNAGTIINSSVVLTQSDLNSYTWPVTINGGTLASPVVVTLGEDVVLSNTQNYFILNGSYINFNGNNHTVTISGIGFYKGLINNGSYQSSWVQDPNDPNDYIQEITIVNGFSNINIFNLTVNAINSDLASGQGWIGQSAFSINATNGVFENCSSNGPIRQGSGGIVGERTSVTVKSSSFFGNHIGGYAGGIFGERSSGTAISCYSLAPSLGNRGGGIFGGNALNATAINSYATSTIVGNSGGIFGGFSTNCNASNCYSLGTIDPSGGGIYGRNSSGGSATNCYSANGNWNDGTANGILQGIGTIWNDPNTNLDTVNYNLKPSPTIVSTTLSSDNSEIVVTFSESVYNSISGVGSLEATDFSLSISGGAANLASTTPISVTTLDNISFTLGIELTELANGNEILTVKPTINSIYSALGQVVSVFQGSNTFKLYDLTPLVITGPSLFTGATSSISINENINEVHTFTANKTVSWSLGTTYDEALFSINSSGDLAFKTAPDFESPSNGLNTNSYVVDVIATDASSNILNQTVTITIDDVAPAVLSSLDPVSKTYFDGSYTIIPPTSSNSNLVTFTSSNPLVATVSGTSVTITGIGSTTITASQTFDATYDNAATSYTLTVVGISVVTKQGTISETDFSYIDRNGKIGGATSITKNGKIIEVQSL